MTMFKPSVLRDIATGCAIVAFSAIFLAAVVPFAIELPIEVAHPALSPRFLPGLLAAVMGLLGLGMAARGIGHELGPVTASTAANPDEAVSGARKVVAIFALLGAAAVLAPIVGMATACAFTACGLMLMAGARRPWAYLLVAAAMPLAMSWIFANFLHVPIPGGSLFDG